MSNADTRRLINRISKYRDTLEVGSKGVEGALTRIGMILSGEMKVNITKKQIIAGGDLRANTTYKIDGNRVEVGTFGIKYAKFHEYGTKWSHKQWLFLQANRERGNRKKSKGVLQFRESGGLMESRIRARPYFKPAIDRRKDMIVEILREALKP